MVNRLFQYSGALFFVSILVVIILSLISSNLNYGVLFTNNSLTEIENYNSNISKISSLESKVYYNKEELNLELYKLIPSDFLEGFSYLQVNLIQEEPFSYYRLKSDSIKPLGLSKEKLKELNNKRYENSDSLLVQIDTNRLNKLPYKKKHFDILYTQLNSGRKYYLLSQSKYLIPNEVISELESIKGEIHDSKSDLKQAARMKLGSKNVDLYWDILRHFIKKEKGIIYWVSEIFEYLFMISLGTIFLCIVLSFIQSGFTDEKAIKEEIKTVKRTIEENPKELDASWQLAKLTLQKYYEKNLIQVKSIFVVSILFLFLGLVLIAVVLVGPSLFNFHIQDNQLTTISGLAIEFVGVILMLIYNSTVKQATKYSESLENINKIGMSIKILDSIDDGGSQKKIVDAKIKIASELIEFNNKVK